MRLPALQGQPITVAFVGQLVAPNGDEVHAAADMRARHIILRRRLLRQPAELRRILLHELFHFVWVRLGNRRRQEFAYLIAGEIKRGLRGELGLSAAWRKEALRKPEGREWRDYLRESFCDSAAFAFSDQATHEEWTLAKQAANARRRWFVETFRGSPLSV